MKKKTNLLYLFICAMIRLFYRKPRFEGTENLPDEPCVILGNHTQMNGPIISELYFPGKNSIWCAGQMMHWGEVAEYAFTDFWSFKPKIFHPFFRLLSWIITPLRNSGLGLNPYSPRMYRLSLHDHAVATRLEK